MAEQVRLPGPASQVLAQLSRPRESPAPAVLVLASEYGEASALLCDRLATAGFLAAAPDLTAQPPVIGARKVSHTPADVAASAAGLLLGQPDLQGSAVVVLAIGGAAVYAFALADALPRSLTAIVQYGGEPPHAPAPVPVLVHLDRQIGRRQALQGGANVNVRMFPGAALSDVGAVAAGGSEEMDDAWEATLSFLRRGAGSDRPRPA